MANRIFKLCELLACDSCGLEWFGAGGEAQARRHAGETGHQVRIVILVRETLNLVSEAYQSEPVAPAALSAEQRSKSRRQAVERLKRAGVAI